MMKRLLLLLLQLSAAFLCHAQQTSNEVLSVNFSAGTAAPGIPRSTTSNLAVVRNIGQASHWVYYCPPSSITALTVELEGSSDGANWTAISEIDSDLICTTIEAGGYWPMLRINPLSVTASASGTLRFFYSSSTSAIPGSGAARGNKSPQPVIQASGRTFVNTSLKSAAQTLSAIPGTLYVIDVTNPNAGTVFVIVSGTLPASPAVYGVQATSSRTIVLGPGESFAANATIACSSNPSPGSDPATGCIVTAVYRGFSTVNAQVNAGGSVQQGSNPVPGAQ